jgi:formylglycine-generating enzyme required for sulfatase activity
MTRETSLPEVEAKSQLSHAATILLDPSKLGVAGSAAPAKALDNGRVLLNRFKLLEVIGEGGMSRVYKALDLRKVEARSADPHVAVKVLTLPFVNYTDAMSVLSREAHSLQSLTHPNILRVIDCDRDGEIVFMTMELLAGKSLFERMRPYKDTGMPRDQGLKIIEGIVKALEFAHGKNMLHGDLKPGNVFITDSGEIKVIDFGLARLMSQPKGRQKGEDTAADRMKALTPAYASPEMWEGNDPDPRDDVYSLACVVWKIMTGEHPFRGQELAARKTGILPARPAQLSRREYRALCHGLEFDRDQRTPSARQFFEEFRSKGSMPSWGLGVGIAVAVLLIAGIVYVSAKPKGEAPHASPTPAIVMAAAAPVPGAVFRDCATCPLMKALAPGEFLQGSKPDEPAAQKFEMPQHKVTIAKSFAAGVYEVTAGEYAEFAAETKIKAQACNAYDGEWRLHTEVTWENAAESQTAAHPVSCVSWQDAKDYAAWLSRRTHQSYRLPSASEWEYAARAGSTAQRPWSDAAGACAYANVADQTAAQHYPGWSASPCADKFVQSAPVGSFAPNAFGLYDMLGNVFEWTDDCWVADYQGAPNSGAPQTDGDCSQHELRGGSWFTNPDFVRAAYRGRFASDYRSTSLGFRLIREIAK